MRLSAFLEAWVQLVLQEGNRVVPNGEPKVEAFVPQQGVTGLKTHHKVAEAPPQPSPSGRKRRTVGAKPRSGSRRPALIAQGHA
ncbi:hypothetical protein M2239_007211 [Bradyrhizobium elkanii]|nr:hypothetical protein [Bradyrhizobium elkanii]